MGGRICILLPFGCQGVSPGFGLGQSRTVAQDPGSQVSDCLKDVRTARMYSQQQGAMSSADGGRFWGSGGSHLTTALVQR